MSYYWRFHDYVNYRLASVCHFALSLDADDKPRLHELQCILYSGKDGRDAQIRIMDQIKPHWIQLAIALKFPPYAIATMERKGDPVYYLLSEWLQEATKKEDHRPVTWRTLIESLRHANLQQEATVLDEHCMIPKETADLDEQCMIPKEASQSGELHVQ